MNIKGKYIKHSTSVGFVYEYTCERCKHPFRSTAPDVNSPALCHGCFVGNHNERRRTHQRIDKRRKAKHLPESEIGTKP